MSPEYVRPYVKAQKNDDRDAEAIAEAATRPTMRFVELKSEDQLDMQTLHRARDQLVGERTALINQLRTVMLERGMIAPQGRHKLERYLAEMLSSEGDATLSPRTRSLIDDLRAEWAELDRRIDAFDSEFLALAREDAAARRLTTSPGIGVLQRHGADRCDRQRRDLREGARPRGLAWAGAAPGHDGRQAATARDQQTWQQVFAQASDPRRPLGLAGARRQRDAAWRLAARSAAAGP
jgi:transposase